eukprot:755326_1
MSNYSQKYDQREIPGCLMFRSGIRCVHEKCFRSYRNKISFPPCFRKFQEGGCSSGKNCEFRHSPDLKKESDKLAKMRSDIMGRLSERDGPSNNRSGGRPSERRSDRRPGSEGLQDRQNNRSGTQNSGGQQGGWQDRQQSSRPTDQSNGWRQSGQSGGQQSGRQRGRRCDDPRQSGQSGGQQQSRRSETKRKKQERELHLVNQIERLKEELEKYKTASSDPKRRPNSHSDDKSDEKFDHKKDKSPLDDRICIVCMEDEAVMAFSPCGHAQTCAACAELVDVCPVCRTVIEGRLRVYY